MRSIRFNSRIAVSVMSLVLLLYLLSSGIAWPDERTRSTGIVSITFDDGSKSQFENGLRISRLYGVKGTLFLNTKHVTEAETANDPWIMSWDEVNAFQNAGWEIGSHSYSHIYLTEIDEAEVVSELDRARADIAEHIGNTPSSFAAPYGDFNEGVLELVKGRHEFNLRAWGENNGRNRMDSVNPYMIERLAVESDMQPSLVCGEMIRAALNNEWLVLMFHEVVMSEPSGYQISANTFEEILACARYLEDNGIVRLETIKSAMARIALAE